MKRKILHTLAAGLTLSIGFTAFAETAPLRAAPIRAEIQKVREDAKEKIAEKKGEVKDARAALASSTKEKRDEIKDMREKMASTTKEMRGERKENRAENMFTKLSARYDATIAREATISSKIQSRIEKIKAAGGITTDAEKFVTAANMHFDEAKTAIASLKTTLDSLTTDTTAGLTKDQMTSIKNGTKEVEKHLKEGHVNLEKALGSLKGLSQARNATSTKEKND